MSPHQKEANLQITDRSWTALIASGFAFAALQPDGKPVHLPYFVAELDAKRARAGLWAFADLPEPGPIILKALRTLSPLQQERRDEALAFDVLYGDGLLGIT